MWTRGYRKLLPTSPELMHAQINKLLAPVSTFFQAALMKQALAEYGISPTNTTCKNELLLHQPINETIENKKAIVQINKTLKQILQKLNMSTNSNGYTLRYTHVRRTRPIVFQQPLRLLHDN